MPEKSLKKIIEGEVLKNELKRSILFSIVFGLMAVIFLLILFVILNDDKLYKKIFTSFTITIGIMAFLSIREFLIARLLKKRISENKSISNRIRFFNYIFEVSAVSLILFVFLYFMRDLFTLSTPVVMIYFIITILSTLSLDWRISLTVGITSSLQYLAIALYALNSENVSASNNVVSEPYIYIGRSILLLAGGAIAGYVSHLLRERIFNTHKILLERNKIINLFGQQVSKSIVDELLNEDANLKSNKKYVCIMFLDIRGFTPFAQNKEPEEIIKYQNDVFGFMIDAINDNNGIINQFLGDGYMATFGAPAFIGNPSEYAVKAALKIVEKLKHKNENKEIPFTRIGIGLHSGFVVAGNVGTDVRKQYSISGDTVILSSRIEQLTKEYDSQLIVSENVINDLNGLELEHTELGEVKLKGNDTPLNLYKLA